MENLTRRSRPTRLGHVGENITIGAHFPPEDAVKSLSHPSSSHSSSPHSSSPHSSSTIFPLRRRLPLLETLPLSLSSQPCSSSLDSWAETGRSLLFMLGLRLATLLIYDSRPTMETSHDRNRATCTLLLLPVSDPPPQRVHPVFREMHV